MKHTMRLLQAATLGFAVLACTPAQAGGVLKVGFDAPSEVEFSTTSPSSRTTFDVDGGMNIAFELHGASDTLDFGLGVEFQSWRMLSNHAAGDVQFQFIPIYLSMRARPKLDDKVAPYLALQLGMAVFRADDTLTLNGQLDTRAGLHFGFGVGAIFGKDLLLELLYTYDTGSFERRGTNVMDVAYSKLSFNFGVYF